MSSSFKSSRCRVIELELALEGPIGQAPAALEHGDRLVEDLLKGHRPPSLCRCGVQKTVWELAQAVRAHVYRRWLTKESRKSWERVTQR